MGEDADGDADLLEDESDPQSDSSEEVDEPTAESDPESDGPGSPDADESDAPASDEPTASPPEATAEDGGTPSSTEQSAVEPKDDDEADETDEADEDDDGEGDAEEAAEADGTDERAEEDDDSEDGSGNLQPANPSDASPESDRLGPDDEPGPADPDRRPRPAEGPNRPPESAERPDVHRPPDPDSPEGESAPLAQEVATGEDAATPESTEEGESATFDEVAERSEPLEDEEMPLTDHIEEMLKRLAVVLVIAGVVSLAVLPVSETVINFLWNSVLPAGETTRPRIYGPLGLVFTKLKVASLAGLVVALPVFVYETYLFMRPGLYPHERRYYLAAIPTSLVLAFVGISFAYFLILPVIFEYFLYYSEDVTTIAFALTKTFNLILLLMGYLAIVFQIPLFIMLAIMMGLTTRLWLVERRLYFWGAFLGISFLFSPDPTGMAPIMVATTMVVLFEGTLLLLKWTGR